VCEAIVSPFNHGRKRPLVKGAGDLDTADRGPEYDYVIQPQLNRASQEGTAAVWKVYNIQTGRIIKAGFETDDQAKDWLERRKDLPDDEHDIDEMDEEEEEEFLESESDDDEGEGAYEPDVEDGEDVREINYPDDDASGDEDDEDEEEDEEEEEEREESDDDDY
jgi:hypothetical protein